MRQATVVLMLSLLSGCTYATNAFRNRADDFADNKPGLDKNDVSVFVDHQNSAVDDFKRLAGYGATDKLSDWRPVVDAGIHYVDDRCDRFISSLFWLNRVREGASRQVTYTGSAASAALAVVEASKNLIGLTPLGFSLFDQTINNVSAGFLYNLNPTTIRVLVERKQAAYLEALSARYTSRVTALQVIQGYAAICLPPAIESEVERAITAQEYKANVIISTLPPKADDMSPDPFTIPDIIDAAPSENIISAPFLVKGIGAPTPISIAQGQYQIGEQAFTAASGLVAVGQPVRVKVKSPAAAGGQAEATLTIGDQSETFKVTTRAAADATAKTVEPDQPIGEVEPPSSEDNALPNPQPQ